MKILEIKQTKNQVAGMIRDAILYGDIGSGEELVQEKLAEQLGVSRMPIREALQLLEQEGFIERLPNRHMKVLEITDTIIMENFSVLSAVEGQVAEIIINNNIDLTPVMDILQSYKISHESLDELNFHIEMVKLINNKYIEGIYKNIAGGYFTFVVCNLKRDASEIEEVLNEFLCNIENRNIPKAKEILKRYFCMLAMTMIKERKNGIKTN